MYILQPQFHLVLGSHFMKSLHCLIGSRQLFFSLYSYSVFMPGDSCRKHISVGAKCKSSWLEVLKTYLYKKAHPNLKNGQMKDTEVEEGIAKEAEAECSPKPSPPMSDSVASPSNSTSSPLQELTLKFVKALESGADGYESLAVEEKLQLLNLLCNDVLSTAYVSSLPIQILSYKLQLPAHDYSICKLLYGLPHCLLVSFRSICMQSCTKTSFILDSWTLLELGLLTCNTKCFYI